MNQLTKKAVMLALKSMLGIAFLVFLSAGTTDYWEGWVFLGICILSLSLIIPYLLIHHPDMMHRRLRTDEVGETEPMQKIFRIIYPLCFALVFIIPGLDRRFTWSTTPLLVNLAGYIPFLTGSYIAFMALRENSFAASVVRVEDEQNVINSGGYALVRHPMYSGIVLIAYSIPLVLGSFWGCLPAFGVLFVLILRLLNEELLLKTKLAGYADYMKRVKYHLIPGVW